MITFAYPVTFEPGEQPGIVVASFADVPEAITQGDGIEDARPMAADALGTALLAYVRAGRPLPRTKAATRGDETISVAPEVAAKLAVLLAFADAGISQRELARRLGKDEREVRRILDPMHATKIHALDEALRTLGSRLVIGVEKLPYRAA